MNESWAVHFPRTKAVAAAHLRLWPNITVREDGDSLWLRGELLDDELDRNLRMVPGAVQYRVDPSGALIVRGERIPRGRLPDENWQPFSTWLVPRPQPSALSGQLADRISLRLTRGTDEKPATVLMTTIADWIEYAAVAPAVRLRPLHFAADANGRIVLRGTPLPPIAGRRFFESDGIAVPCGYSISPPLDSAVLRELLHSDAEDLVLFHEDGSCERVDAGQFVAATRSTVRATARSFESLPSGGVASDV